MAHYKCFSSLIFSVNSTTQITKKFTFLLCCRSAPLLMKWNRQENFYTLLSFYSFSNQEGKHLNPWEQLDLTSFSLCLCTELSICIYMFIRRTKFPLRLRSQFLKSSGSSQTNTVMWILSPEILSKFWVDCNLI